MTYKIVICEIHNSRLHGESNAKGHYLILQSFADLFNNSNDVSSETSSDCSSDDSSDDIYDVMFECKEYMNELVATNDRRIMNHPIRNYKNIIVNDSYIQPHIAKCIYLPDETSVAIIKTFWIKLIQRNWKRVYAIRQNVINLRKRVGALKYRELYRRWPEDCIRMPSLYGLLTTRAQYVSQ